MFGFSIKPPIRDFLVMVPPYTFTRLPVKVNSRGHPRPHGATASKSMIPQELLFSVNGPTGRAAFASAEPAMLRVGFSLFC